MSERSDRPARDTTEPKPDQARRAPQPHANEHVRTDGEIRVDDAIGISNDPWEGRPGKS
jgi:hypothetical protein